MQPTAALMEEVEAILGRTVEQWQKSFAVQMNEVGCDRPSVCALRCLPAEPQRELHEEKSRLAEVRLAPI